MCGLTVVASAVEERAFLGERRVCAGVLTSIEREFSFSLVEEVDSGIDVALGAIDANDLVVLVCSCDVLGCCVLEDV